MDKKSKLFLSIGLFGSCLWAFGAHLPFFVASYLRYVNEIYFILPPPLWVFNVSLVIESLSMIPFAFGLYGVFLILKEDEKILAMICLLSGILSTVIHLIIDILELYAQIIGKVIYESFTEDMYSNFLIWSSTVGGAGFFIFGIALFLAIVQGLTNFPRWTCVFNMMLLATFFSLKNYSVHYLSLGGIFMFLGLLITGIIIEKKKE